MSNYGQFCPVAKTLEILGDRWTLLIVRNMLCGMTHFNDLERSLPGISRSLLARRLRQMQQAGVIDKQMNGSGRQSTEYMLTTAGRELHTIIIPMMMWGEAWACGEPVGEELDALLMMWLMRVDVQKARLPKNFVAVQFDFHGVSSETYWLLMTPVDVSVCITNPGYEIDVLVTADLAAYHQLWYGRITYDEAIRDYGVTVEGLPRIVRAFPDWFAWRTANGMRHARAARQRQSAMA